MEGKPDEIGSRYSITFSHDDVDRVLQFDREYDYRLLLTDRAVVIERSTLPLPAPACCSTNTCPFGLLAAADVGIVTAGPITRKHSGPTSEESDALADLPDDMEMWTRHDVATWLLHYAGINRDYVKVLHEIGTTGKALVHIKEHDFKHQVDAKHPPWIFRMTASDRCDQSCARWARVAASNLRAARRGSGAGLAVRRLQKTEGGV